jgi:alanine racemase
MKKLPTWVEVDLDRLAGNLSALRGWLGDGVRILLTVKADAYGHGAVQVAQAASRNGAERVDMFGVATLDEATELKESGISTPILILSPVLERELPAVISSGFAITVSSFDMAESVSRQAAAAGRVVDVHVEVDTGMGRTGVGQEQARTEIIRIAALKGLRLQGVYTHFPVSDTDPDFTRTQIDALERIVAELRAAGVEIPMVHSANSAAVAGVKESHMDLVRPGLLAYGLHPNGARVPVEIEPVLSWKSRLVQVRDVPAGKTISYGRDFTTTRDSVIGVVPVGYGHGYPFAASGRGRMIVAGARVPIVGRVTMDMTMVDLTDLPRRPAPGDEVVLVGESDGASISFHDVAAWSGSICYEIMCGISKRVPRTYFRRGRVETYKSLLGVLPTHIISV